MTQKKISKKHTKDQVKHTHREAFKGHRTRKHYLSEVQAEEALDAIHEQQKKRRGE